SGPFVIRYPRGQGELVEWKNEMKIIPIGKGRKLRDGKDIALLSIGSIGNTGASAIEKAKEYGLNVAHYDLLFLKPLDEELLKEVAENYQTIVTLENGSIEGGMGSAVIEFFADNGYNNLNIHRLGIKDEFISHGSTKDLLRYCELDEEGILKLLIKVQKLNEGEI
ncbi:MAG: transketolase C-terminal domain-containing protein, partial [Dysgonamonadaceae bacterium]